MTHQPFGRNWPPSQGGNTAKKTKCHGRMRLRGERDETQICFHDLKRDRSKKRLVFNTVAPASAQRSNQEV